MSCLAVSIWRISASLSRAEPVFKVRSRVRRRPSKLETPPVPTLLQVLFFAPVNLLEPEASFRRFAGRLIVSPVVRVLVFSKVWGPLLCGIYVMLWRCHPGSGSCILILEDF